jgi:hypothetical protein
MSTPRRRTGVLVAGISCAAVLLTGCGAGDEPAAASGSSSTAPAPATASETEQAPASGLAEGLLPAEAFGAEATVVPVSREQLQQGAGLAADPASLDITPEGCAAAVEGTQPQIEDFEEVAAQSATVGGATTVEVLLQGEATAGAVEGLAGAAARCPEAVISSPELGEARVRFEDLEVPDLGDGAAAVRYTTTLTRGGQEVSVPTLVGLVQDGDRAITLLTIATDGSQPDATAFASLLEQAFEVQAEALG